MKFSVEQFLDLRKAHLVGESLTDLITSWEIPIDFEVISFIYDLQAGSYTTYAHENLEYTVKFTDEISEVASRYLSNKSIILDCGTGESNIFIPLLKNLNMASGIGVDASISRLTWAQQNALNSELHLNLAAADFGKLPLPDNSVDAVLTVHALEPNGGREYELLKELGRVSRKFIFLVEPDFENATIEQKSRMSRLNFVRNLDLAILQCGFSVCEKIAVVNNSRASNSASITVIDVSQSNSTKDFEFSWVDPTFKEPLTEFEGGLINTMGFWYPVIRDIPLLRDSDSQYLFSPAF